MRIGFAVSDILKGGKYENVFYDNLKKDLDKQVKIDPKDRDVRWIEVRSKDMPYNWFEANYMNIKWRGVQLYVEGPAALASVKVPNWLPKYQYTDEDGNVITHTFKTWGGVARERLDKSRILINLQAKGLLDQSQIAKAITLIKGKASRTGMLHKEARAITSGVDYTPAGP